jgi:hypothetical protein
MNCFSKETKPCKIIAGVVLFFFVSNLLPAESIEYSMRNGKVRLEHYLTKADLERSEEKWSILSKQGMFLALEAWEKDAINSSENLNREQAEQYFQKEIDKRYIEWKTQKFLEENVKIERSIISKKLNEAASSWNYTKEDNTATRILSEDEAASARIQWQNFAGTLVNEYAVVSNFSAEQILGINLAGNTNKTETEAIIEQVRKSYQKQLENERQDIIQTEANELLRYLLYDQYSLRKDSDSKSAAMIATALANDTNTVTTDRMNNLFASLETVLENKEEDMTAAQEEWLRNFNKAMTASLEKWDEAEETFLIKRSEWEREAYGAFEEGNEAWDTALNELLKRRNEWTKEILQKYEEGCLKWENEQTKLNNEVKKAYEDLYTNLLNEKSIKDKILETQVSMYNTNRNLVLMTQNGIDGWFTHFAEKYKGLYSYWKTEPESNSSRATELDNLKDFDNSDSTKKSNFEKQAYITSKDTAVTLLNTINIWKTSYIATIKNELQKILDESQSRIDTIKSKKITITTSMTDDEKSAATIINALCENILKNEEDKKTEISRLISELNSFPHKTTDITDFFNQLFPDSDNQKNTNTNPDEQIAAIKKEITDEKDSLIKTIKSIQSSLEKLSFNSTLFTSYYDIKENCKLFDEKNELFSFDDMIYGSEEALYDWLYNQILSVNKCQQTMDTIFQYTGTVSTGVIGEGDNAINPDYDELYVEYKKAEAEANYWAEKEQILDYCIKYIKNETASSDDLEQTNQKREDSLSAYENAYQLYTEKITALDEKYKIVAEKNENLIQGQKDIEIALKELYAARDYYNDVLLSYNDVSNESLKAQIEIFVDRINNLYPNSGDAIDQKNFDLNNYYSQLNKYSLYNIQEQINLFVNLLKDGDLEHGYLPLKDIKTDYDADSIINCTDAEAFTLKYKEIPYSFSYEKESINMNWLNLTKTDITEKEKDISRLIIQKIVSQINISNKKEIDKRNLAIEYLENKILTKNETNPIIDKQKALLQAAANIINELLKNKLLDDQNDFYLNLSTGISNLLEDNQFEQKIEEIKKSNTFINNILCGYGIFENSYLNDCLYYEYQTVMYNDYNETIRNELIDEVKNEYADYNLKEIDQINKNAVSDIYSIITTNNPESGSLIKDYDSLVKYLQKLYLAGSNLNQTGSEALDGYIKEYVKNYVIKKKEVKNTDPEKQKEFVNSQQTILKDKNNEINYLISFTQVETFDQILKLINNSQFEAISSENSDFKSQVLSQASLLLYSDFITKLKTININNFNRENLTAWLYNNLPQPPEELIISEEDITAIIDGAMNFYNNSYDNYNQKEQIFFDYFIYNQKPDNNTEIELFIKNQNDTIELKKIRNEWNIDQEGKYLNYLSSDNSELIKILQLYTDKDIIESFTGETVLNHLSLSVLYSYIDVYKVKCLGTNKYYSKDIYYEICQELEKLYSDTFYPEQTNDTEYFSFTIPDGNIYEEDALNNYIEGQRSLAYENYKRQNITAKNYDLNMLDVFWYDVFRTSPEFLYVYASINDNNQELLSEIIEYNNAKQIYLNDESFTKLVDYTRRKRIINSYSVYYDGDISEWLLSKNVEEKDRKIIYDCLEYGIEYWTESHYNEQQAALTNLYTVNDKVYLSSQKYNCEYDYVLSSLNTILKDLITEREAINTKANIELMINNIYQTYIYEDTSYASDVLDLIHKNPEEKDFTIKEADPSINFTSSYLDYFKNYEDKYSLCSLAKVGDEEYINISNELYSLQNNLMSKDMQRLQYLAQIKSLYKTLEFNQNENLDSLKLELKKAEQAMALKKDDYEEANNEYNRKFSEYTQSVTDYNMALTDVDAAYKNLETARLQYRKDNELYEWAENTYLRAEYDTNKVESYNEEDKLVVYETPQEKLAKVKKSKEAADLSYNVLRAVIDEINAKTESQNISDTQYNTLLKDYKTAEENYYLISVLADEITTAIAKQREKLSQSENIALYSLNAIINPDTNRMDHPNKYEIKDEILNYIVISEEPEGSSKYTFKLKKNIKFDTNKIKDEQGNVIKTEIVSSIYNVDLASATLEQNQKKLFNDYLNNVYADSELNEYHDRLAQVDAENWLRKMNDKSEWTKETTELPEDYLSKVVIAALYLEYMGITNNKENSLPADLKFIGAFQNICDDNIVFDISTKDKKTHGIDYQQEMKDRFGPTLESIFDEVDEEDIAKYLLYKDNYISSGLGLEQRAQQYLHSILFKEALDYAEDEADDYWTAGAVLTALAAPFFAIAASIFGWWAIIPALGYTALAATEYVKARDTDDLVSFFKTQYSTQIQALRKIAIKLPNGISDIDAANKTVKENKDYLNLLLYGTSDNITPENAKPLTYESFKNSLTKSLTDISYLFKSNPKDKNKKYKEPLVDSHIEYLFENLITGTNYKEIAEFSDGTIPNSTSEIISNILNHYRNQMESKLNALNSYAWGTKDKAGNYTSDDSLIQTKLKNAKEYNDYVASLIKGETEIITTAEKPEDTTEAILLDKAIKAWGFGTFRSKDYYEDIIAIYNNLDKNKLMYNREVETYLEGSKNDLGQLSGYPGIIDSYIKNYKDALDAEIQLKLELKNDENQRLLDDLAEQKSNWYTQMSYILSVANAEWKKAEQRLNNDRNTWEQEFVRVYDNKIEEWNQTYRDFSESKAAWVKEQYMKASQGKWEEATAEQDINRENIIQQVFLKTGLISKINDAVQNMAEETDSYIQGLTSSAIFKRSLEVAGSITDNIGAGIKHTKQGNTINTQNDTWLKEALESSKELEEHYEKISAKLTEQQMADQLRATIDGYMAQIDARNEGMRDWEESLVLQNGYTVNGNTIQREIIIDSTLTKNIKKTQSVYAYENFRVARPEQEITAGGSEEGKSLIESILDGIVNVKKWAEKIFGKAKDAKGNPVERTITKTKAGTDTRKNMENNDAQQLLEDYLKTAKEYDDNQSDLYATDEYNKYKGIKSDIEKMTSEEYKDWAKNNKKDNETYNKVSRQITQIQDGAINEWIGYAPTLKEGEEFKINKSKWENIEYEGKGQMGLIMLDFQWNSIEEQNGLAELSKPMYDKKMWDDDGAWLQPPTVRSVADIALDIVGNATGQKWLGWVDDALFGLMDVSGGYKTAQEVGLELGKKALTQFVSSKIGNATEWAKDAAGTALKSASTAANVAAQAGISVASSYASSVTSSAINSFNIVDGELKFDSKNFTKSLYSSSAIGGAIGAGITAGLGEYNLGTRKVDALDKDGNIITDKATGKPVKINEYTRAKGLNSAQIENMGKFNSLMGGLASSAVSFAIDGQATFNLLNISDFGVKSNTGLFELTVGKKGVSSRIGTGGTNISMGNLMASFNGAKATVKNTQINNAVNKNYEGNKNVANMLRAQYGFGDKVQLDQLDSILKGNTELVFGNTTDGQAQTVDENGKRIVHMNMDQNGDWKMGAIMLGHESYRDGIVSSADAQLEETRRAVKGHTEMTVKMMNDKLYMTSMMDLIGSNQNLQNDLIYYTLGDDAFNSYIDGNYSSKADYWLLKTDGTIVWDGSKDLNAEYYDENGQLHTNDKSEEDYKSSATPYIVVKAGKDATYAGTLAEYVGEERAEQILSSSGKNINDAGSYSKTALMDIFGVSKEVATQMQHTGRLPSNMTPEQKQRLIGEALMANGGMTWDGKSRGNTNSFSLAMSDYDIGQIVINPIYDSKKNIIGYDRFGITAEVYRDELSYSSTRNETSTHLAINGKQGLDYMYLYKKDLNGNTIASTMNEPFSKGWQTVANGFADPDMETRAYPSFNIKDGYSDNVYRGSTVVENQNFYMRFGNFTSDTKKFDGNIFIINRAQTLSEGMTNLVGLTKVSNDPIEGHSNWLNNPTPHEDTGGLISASCFMNTRDNLNFTNSWVMNNVPYPSYDVKTVVRPKYGPMWR